MNVLAVDPGNVTGLATLHSDSGSFLSWEKDAIPATAGAEMLCRHWADLVVCESFTPRPGAYTWQPDALYTIGAIRYLCAGYNVQFALQSPASAKKFSTNDKLRRIGWYVRTKGGHANDAARHLLLVSVKLGLVEPEMFLE